MYVRILEEYHTGVIRVKFFWTVTANLKCPKADGVACPRFDGYNDRILGKEKG